MKPPYEITNKILNLLISISEKIGEINAAHLHKPSPELRKKNRVKTIKASLEIEGNSMSEEQITAIIENKRVAGPKEDIIEVINAINVYEKLESLNPYTLKSFLNAHKLLMKGLIDSPGKLRMKPVGIFKGDKISHVAPPSENLETLMKNLFTYLKKSDDHILIKSCVAHYEIEFIHPFMDGNGRMGRLWQTLILLETYPIFEFLPFETIIKVKQEEYYQVLERSDKEGKSTSFIAFMLAAIDESLHDLLNLQNRSMTTKDRIEFFLYNYKESEVTRKDYLNIFKDISSATASRDLRFAVTENLIRKSGDKKTSRYSKIK